MKTVIIGVLVGVSIAAACVWVLNAQTVVTVAPGSRIYTPAHSSISEAVRHFFGIRPEPKQPIAYTHKPHIKAAGLTCENCHTGVRNGPIAHFPSVTMCMSCHDEVDTDKPSIQQLTAYFEKGQEPPWQRVYGWNEEAHVRFNHAPHMRAGVACTTCHGDVAEMTVARRVVDHTMGFCVNCHLERKASNDCLTCHY